MRATQLPPLLFTLLALTGVSAAQTPAFTTPGMPRVNTGQTDRFSSEFNPAFGLVADLVGSYTEVEGSGADGIDLTLRTLEGTVNAYVDPRLWAYAVVVVEGEEEFELEEAAMQWIGWDSNATLRAGRFFVDFGKQMQAHVHDTQFVERPLALRTYLGSELAGTGVQFDNWFALGDETAVRYSFGVFESLVAGHDFPELGGAELPSEAEPLAAERPGLDELSVTGRITGFRDVGESGVLQLGSSARWLPEYSLALDGNPGAQLDDLSNLVVGLDATYGWSNDRATRTWDIGGELLLFDGDLGGAVLDAGTPADTSDDTIALFDDAALGHYLWTQYGWNPTNRAGLLVSQVELPQAGLPQLAEYDLFFTHAFSEFSWLRLALRYTDAGAGAGVDELALVVQFTNVLGPHAHGLNW